VETLLKLERLRSTATWLGFWSEDLALRGKILAREENEELPPRDWHAKVTG
jgi:hypothetical protein